MNLIGLIPVTYKIYQTLRIRNKSVKALIFINIYFGYYSLFLSILFVWIYCCKNMILIIDNKIINNFIEICFVKLIAFSSWMPQNRPKRCRESCDRLPSYVCRGTRSIPRACRLRRLCRDIWDNPRDIRLELGLA